MKKKRAAQNSKLAKVTSRLSLRPEKVELAKRRIAEGFYSSPLIEQLVIERLLSDPQFLKTE